MGDTLILRPDSSARGLIPWTDTTMARISEWRVVYSSKQDPTERADWRHGYSGRGDADCFFRRVVDGCVSMPVFCFVAGREFKCEGFKYTAPDSLDFSTGLRYVRLARHTEPISPGTTPPNGERVGAAP